MTALGAGVVVETTAESNPGSPACKLAAISASAVAGPL